MGGSLSVGFRPTFSIGVLRSDAHLDHLVGGEKVPAVDFRRDVVQFRAQAVGDDQVAASLEGRQVGDHLGTQVPRSLQHRLVDQQFDAHVVKALHDALHAGGAEIVRAFLHDQAVHPHGARPHARDAFGDEIHARGVRVDDRSDQVLRHVVIVCQQLSGVLG